MNIEIIGRHALLFDDDTTAAFVNSDDALVEWNSLLIDRYDVRHLLSTPPPSRRRRNPQTTHSSFADAEIDYERYLDLLSQPDEQEEDAEPEQPEPVGGFNAVPFSYGNYEDCNDQKTAETESEISGFYPPFPVPDSLVQNLPPTEKVHQIIARTALFVSKYGGQSEIVLRVKQGDNPTFGFLMPDHHLHPYFKYLVDHQDLLQSKDDGQPKNEEKTSNTGALSLLGSAYGTGEDDDGGVEHPSSSSSKECVSGNTMDVDATSSLSVGKTMLPADNAESVSERLLSSKEDTFIIKKNSQPNALKSGRTGSLKKGESAGLLSAVPDKSRASSLPPLPKTEHLLLVDPPSDMKRLVDKIVEFIIRNGRQFEAVLMEQDRGHGRFPFLLPSNIFHPYYLKVLQKAQEPKLSVKSLQNEKEDIRGHTVKKKSISKENEISMVESDDIPLDSERKEKFKMVINKSKKEGSDFPAKEPQQPLGVQMDAAQVAAILQAATRGITHPNLGTLFGKSSNEDESSDSHMTHEQKLKAERLKRAKMFVAKLKNGAAPPKAEPSRGLSAEPSQGSEADNHLAAKERERSSTPFDIDTLDKRVKSEKDLLDEERRAKRKYRARGEPTETQEDEEDDVDGDEREERRSHRHHKKKHRSHNHSAEDESEEKYEDKRDYKHSKKRHRSHRSSHKHDDTDQGNDEKDHKYSRKNLRRSSYDDSEKESEHEYSRKKHRSRHSTHDVVSDDEVDSDHRYSRNKHSHKSSRHRSRRSSHHSRDRYKNRKNESSSHRQKLDASSEDESRDHNKADKHVKGSNSEKEELEEGEISSKSDQSKGGPLVNREPSVDVSSSLQDQRPPRQPSETTTEVPDDLRAKIRAMLMSTM